MELRTLPVSGTVVVVAAAELVAGKPAGADLAPAGTVPDRHSGEAHSFRAASVGQVPAGPLVGHKAGFASSPPAER